jgi:hypothetical protein
MVLYNGVPAGRQRRAAKLRLSPHCEAAADAAAGCWLRSVPLLPPEFAYVVDERRKLAVLAMRVADLPG